MNDTEKQEKIDNIENILIAEGILVPASDVANWIVRNACYMRLIDSKEFKDSGIKLEEVLDDEFVGKEVGSAKHLVGMMRFATEEIIPKMQEVIKTDKEKLAQAKELLGVKPEEDKSEGKTEVEA